MVTNTQHQGAPCQRSQLDAGWAPQRCAIPRWSGLATLVSVGHVALPFRPDDPAYGVNPGSGHNGLPSIGSWLFRGEPGAVTVNLGSLTRPRSNPFWALINVVMSAPRWITI